MTELFLVIWFGCTASDDGTIRLLRVQKEYKYRFMAENAITNLTINLDQSDCPDFVPKPAIYKLVKEEPPKETKK